MARSRLITTIKKDGPFFQRDPRKTFRQNIQTLMDAVALEGATDVIAQQLATQSSRRPIRRLGDHTSSHVVGRTSSGGRRWAVTAVVSVRNKGWTRAQAVSLMAAASRVERATGAFRRTTTRLRRMRKINAAELLKGIK